MAQIKKCECGSRNFTYLPRIKNDDTVYVYCENCDTVYTVEENEGLVRQDETVLVIEYKEGDIIESKK